MKLKALGKTVKFQQNEIDPKVLELIPVPKYFREVTYEAQEFTSLCPVTGQPDVGRINVTLYKGNASLIGLVESKSLKGYLFGFRNTGMFHEAICSRIAEDIGKLTHATVLVDGSFRARGGIAIKPRAFYKFNGK